ncbi:MAG: hypothetical protein V1701_00600 [Planctomycetota bacterium]
MEAKLSNVVREIGAVVLMLTLAIIAGCGPSLDKIDRGPAPSESIILGPEVQQENAVIFIGKIIEISPAPGIWSGFMPAEQSVTYQVIDVLKNPDGVSLNEKQQIYYFIIKGSNLCDPNEPKLLAEIFSVGNKVIVFASYDSKQVPHSATLEPLEVSGKSVILFSDEVKSEILIKISGNNTLFWDGLLVKALKENKEFSRQLKMRDEWFKDFNETALDGGYHKITIADLDGLLTEPCRFYLIGGRVFGLDSKPPACLRVGITTEGNLFLLKISSRIWDGTANLQPYLKPVATKDAALQAALVAARLLAFCGICEAEGHRLGAVTPAKCTVECTAENDFKVIIPPEAIADNDRQESAEIIFTRGKLTSAKKTGHSGGHK